MSLRARSKYVAPSRPAANAGATLFCTASDLACHWARLVLQEKEVEGVRVAYERRERPSEDLLVLNPERHLPTLVDRSVVVHPARFIVQYLDERFPHPPLMPSEPAYRAALRMVMERLELELFPLLEHVEENTRPAAAEECGRRLQSVARLFPARGWFLGLEYSLADAGWGVLAWRYEQSGWRWPPGTEAIRQHAQRAHARPAFSRSLAPSRP